MSSESKVVEDPEPGQAVSNERQWDRSPPEPLFTHPRTWTSYHVDGFRCPLITGRDVAGDSRLALFVRSILYGSLSPRPRARPGRLSCRAVRTQPDEVSFLEGSGVKSDNLRTIACQSRKTIAISAYSTISVCKFTGEVTGSSLHYCKKYHKYAHITLLNMNFDNYELLTKELKGPTLLIGANHCRYHINPHSYPEASLIP